MTHRKGIFNAAIAGILVLGLVAGFAGCGTSTSQGGGNERRTAIDMEQALNRLDSLYEQIDVYRLTPRMDGAAAYEEVGTVLPDISEYPFVVNPTTDNYLTIYASPEKSGTGYASWLIDIAESFNKSGSTVHGQPISVGVRSIPNGLGADFISSGKYKPDVFAPSSELWGDVLIGRGITISRLDVRTAGNVAGVVLSTKKNEELTNKYGSSGIDAVVNGVLNGEVALAYADPLSNTEGLNFLLTAMRIFDAADMFSDTSIIQFRQLQDSIVYVAYDSAQLKGSALGGSLDGFVSDYHTYINSPELGSSYKFIPFGVRHDQPLYEIGELSEIKHGIALAFSAYCKTSDSQNLASDKGFNGLEDYVYEYAKPEGRDIIRAQEIWKQEKSGSRDLTAVFVADISGSMEGSPILKLKASLYRAADFIDANTNIGLVTFSDSVNIALPIAKFDNAQRAGFTNAVRSMQEGGGTAMFDAAVVALKMLTEAQERNPNTKLMLFILTDGESNRGYTFKDTEDVIAGLRIPVYTIGYNADIENLRLLSNINEATAMDAETDDIIYKLQSLFNVHM